MIRCTVRADAGAFSSCPYRRVLDDRGGDTVDMVMAEAGEDIHSVLTTEQVALLEEMISEKLSGIANR